MSREPLDMDMGDDDQADDIVEYERYVEDPPADHVIRNHEAEVVQSRPIRIALSTFGPFGEMQ